MANTFSVEELTEIESVFNERAMAAAKGDDPDGYKKYGKLAIRTGQMIEAANQPKKERKARQPRAVVPSSANESPGETYQHESPERSSRKGQK